MIRSGYDCALTASLALVVAALTAPTLHAAVITDFAVFGNTGVTLSYGTSGSVAGGMIGSNSGTVLINAGITTVTVAMQGGGNFSSTASTVAVSSLMFDGSVSTSGSNTINGTVIAGGAISLGSSNTINGDLHSGSTISFSGSTNMGQPVDANKLNAYATGNISSSGSSINLDVHLHSGGNISLSSTTTVHGNATAAGTNTGGTVNGTRTAGGSPTAPTPSTFTTVAMPTAAAGSFSGGANINHTNTTSHASPLAPGHYGTLDLSAAGSHTVYLTAGDYYFSGNFNLGGSDILNLNTSGGEINIFVNGTLTIGGSSAKVQMDSSGSGTYDAYSTVLANPTKKAATSLIYFEVHGTGTAFSLGGSSEFLGTVVALNGAVSTSSSGTRVLGGLYAGTSVALAGGTQVNYVEAAMLHINNSVLSLPGGTLDFGSVLVGYTDSQNVLLSKTGADATTYTALASDGGLSVGASGAFAGGSQNENLSVNLLANANGTGTAGARNWTVTIDNTGRNSQDPDEVLSVTAAVYAAASLTANDSTTLGDGDAVSIANAVAVPLRATAYVDSYNISADWSLVGLGVGSTIAPGSDTTGAHVSLDQTGLLNGQTITGLLSIALENDQSLGGAANQDLGTYHWNLSHTVTGNVGTGTADVGDGSSYAGLHGVSDQTLGSTAALLAGTNTSGGDTVVEVAWRDRTAGEAGGFAATLPTGALGLFSDVAQVTGTDGTVFVLELSVDPSVLLTAYENVFLSWYDTGDDLWKLATLGNHGANTVNPLLLNYQGSWADSGAGLTLGAYGFDAVNLTVWAVLDHNSEFSTLGIGSYEVIPEPSALAVLTAWALGVLGRRRRRR